MANNLQTKAILKTSQTLLANQTTQNFSALETQRETLNFVCVSTRSSSTTHERAWRATRPAPSSADSDSRERQRSDKCALGLERLNRRGRRGKCGSRGQNLREVLEVTEPTQLCLRHWCGAVCRASRAVKCAYPSVGGPPGCFTGSKDCRCMCNLRGRTVRDQTLDFSESFSKTAFSTKRAKPVGVEWSAAALAAGGLGHGLCRTLVNRIVNLSLIHI